MKDLKIKIKGVEFKVELIDDLGLLNGKIEHENRKIKLQKDLPCDELLETIAHEILHGYLFQCGLRDYCNDETLVRWLGLHIFEIVKQSNDLYTVINKKLRTRKQ